MRPLIKTDAGLFDIEPFGNECHARRLGFSFATRGRLSGAMSRSTWEPWGTYRTRGEALEAIERGTP